MIAVIAVTAVNFVNVIMRYIFKSGLAYCENLSLALFMLLILIGGNIAVKSDSEIRIDVCRFKDVRKKNAFKLISDICSITWFYRIGSAHSTVQSAGSNTSYYIPAAIQPVNYRFHFNVI